MLTSQRRREILRRVAEEGYVEARALAGDLAVDPSTIRRDLDALARARQITRVRGGARPAPSGAADVPYVVKQQERLLAKTAIAQAAAELVADGMSVVLDSGSTIYQVGLALRERRGLTVVTNDLRTAKMLATVPDMRLLVSGGELLGSVYSLVGHAAETFVRDVAVDMAFLGADAIEVAAGITNTNSLEVPLKRAMMESAGRTVVCADSSKFGRRALVKVAALDEVGLVLTDTELPEGEAGPYGGVLRRVPVAETPAPDPGDGDTEAVFA
ncbi:DeoR/GlpR transcriptional regulator [Spongiactinospora gelatinilytica]|uniref:Lactose phosphotransferase system repressor n=1 Tax=Spongiactinospora gelatinilytica TaxID=2666298 RepID=A0A2W2I0L4_9ACTN|nr:DeoR/GlpR family DNA-binding transcription regulator [Spongiactinospora gelatinilytica]PZG55538.1 DeoR/GlpR transcriptional regulator [Spongiactinospora gelatinilytica]